MTKKRAAHQGDMMLTPPQVAATLGVNEQTLAVWRRTGRCDLPFVRVGRSIKYKLSDAQAWLDFRTATCK